MKKILLFACSQLAAFSLSAQLINFDNYVSATNNDLVNHFSGGYNLSQVTGNGITGGAVKTTTNEQGSALYRMFQIGATPVTASICFKYSGSLNQNDGNHAAILRFFNPTSLNYIEARADAGYIQISSSGSQLLTSTVTGGGTLDDNHWYKLEITISSPASNPDTMTGGIFLYDLGTSGTSSPTVKLSRPSFTIDNVFYPDNSARLEFNGSERGGASYLDNFFSQGPFATSVSSINSAGDLKMITTSDALVIKCTKNTPVEYKVYAMNGTTLAQGLFTSNWNFSLNGFPVGCYLLVLQKDGQIYREKFIK